MANRTATAESTIPEEVELAQKVSIAASVLADVDAGRVKFAAYGNYLHGTGDAESARDVVKLALIEFITNTSRYAIDLYVATHDGSEPAPYRLCPAPAAPATPVATKRAVSRRARRSH